MNHERPQPSDTPQKLTLQRQRLLHGLLFLHDTKRQEEHERSERSREALRDLTYLPNRADIAEAFPEHRRDNAWWQYCHDPSSQHFEVLTREYVAGLGGYLAKRAIELQYSEDRPMRVVEVGAGNGRLSHFLNRHLTDNNPGLAIVLPIDSGQWNIQPTFPVETMTHARALRDYEPDVVLCSWMLPKTDLTRDFRATQSVHEYILIGIPYGTLVGNGFETWGEDPMYYWEDLKRQTPYEADGFERSEVEGVSGSLQLSRLDNPPDDCSRSATIAFRRTPGIDV